MPESFEAWWGSFKEKHLQNLGYKLALESTIFLSTTIIRYRQEIWASLR
jgi:hypothetical protein